MDPLAHLQTALAERYRVEKLIGVGGMATVYLARDLRHDRNVALKLLKPELGAVLGVERFLSEIRVTANLQHPHLLPLFDSGEADGLLYYVMPFVEGESLRGRLDREKQLPVNEAIRITIAVAGALDYAHRHNVVHRDLKPENILLQDGQPVVSDFGIALAVTNAGGTRVTQTGLSLGTPQYMSPEQATGDRVIDARSDIYSLGAVLYEMLTGEPPHTGATVQAIIARVLTDKARSVRATRDMVPENVDAAITRALAKLPADRFATAKEFADALQDSRFTLPVRTHATSPAALAPAAGPATRIRAYLPWAVAAAASIIALVSLTSKSPMSPYTPTPARFEITLPDNVVYTANAAGVAISRDGSQIALIVRRSGTQMIAVRPIRETQVRLVEGTESGTRPFFSPDGRTLGFMVADRLKTVPVTGGVSSTVVNAGITGTATWTDLGIMYSANGQILKVAATGGTPAVFVADTAFRYAWPSAGPDGRVLLTRTKGADRSEIVVAEPDGKIRPLDEIGIKPQWLSTGFVLYNTTDGALMALPVDAKKLTRAGSPILIQHGIRIGAGAVGFWSASTNGTIVAEIGRDVGSTLGIVDRNGQFTALSNEERNFRLPRLSPDGKRIALQAGTSGTNTDSDIWVFDRGTETLSRFTSNGGNSDPIWSWDGRYLIYAGPEKGDSGSGRESSDIYRQDVDQTSPPELLHSAIGNQYPWGVTPDDKTVVFDAGPGNMRIRALTIGEPNSARDVVANTYINRLAKLSRDGKWLAYTSNQNGRMEVYVRSFPGPGGTKQVSVDGGDQPLWSRDGRELYFRDGASLIAATMSNGVVQSRRVLFADTYQQSNATNYDVLPDGRFIMLKGSADLRVVTVMMNWATELDQKLRASSR
ncbi:MAG TPA: protein kinase [Gemmatimonadaceae bacterium]